MNTDQISGKWKEFKGEFRSQWGKITDDELEKTKGNAQALQGLVQQRYGDKQEGFKEKITGLLDKYSLKLDDTVERAKNILKH